MRRATNPVRRGHQTPQRSDLVKGLASETNSQVGLFNQESRYIVNAFMLAGLKFGESYFP